MRAVIKQPGQSIVTLLLDCQRRVLERIASGAPLDEVLVTLVTLVERLAPGLRCAILQADAAGKRLRFVAAPNIPEDFKLCVEPFLGIAPDALNCAVAACRREPVYTDDIALDSRWIHCRDVALRNAIRAAWSTPILGDDNSVLGTFALFYGKPGLPSSHHVQVIEMAVQMARVAFQSKQDEERLRAREREYRDVIDNIPAIAWTARPDGPGEFTNRSWLEYTGQSTEEAAGWGWVSTVHPEDAAKHLASWHQAVASGEPFESEARYRRADGIYRWFLARGVPLRDAQGNIQRWYGILVDIEDGKRAREALQKSERLLREAEQLGHTGSWEHDLLSGEIFNTRENLRLFFGDDRTKGARFEDYLQAIHPDDRAYVRERHAKLLADSGPSDIEYRVVWPDGSVHVIFGRATVVRDESGRAVRVYGTNVDATERKRAEAAVRENERLLEFVLETLPISVVVTDDAGDIILANAATRRVWAGEIIVSGAERRARVKGFWHSSGKPLSPGEWASAVAVCEGREVVNELIDIEAFDGRRKTIENSAAPIRNCDGAIIGAVVVNHEVTDRVCAETALRESAQRLQHLSRRLLALQEEERRNLSRELHDRLGETLTALSINLSMLKDGVQRDECAMARVEDSAALVKSTAAVMENLIGELRPPMLDDHGLAAALDWYGKQFAARAGIAVSVQADEPGARVAPEVGIALFRIAQEALTNVAKHAQAGRVAISLRRAGGELVMSICDDGIGLDSQSQRRGSGLGMVTMRERAQAVGGRFEVQRLAERGTRLTVTVPL
jgi:PAS domain S-box-containing protein